MDSAEQVNVIFLKVIFSDELICLMAQCRQNYAFFLFPQLNLHLILEPYLKKICLYLSVCDLFSYLFRYFFIYWFAILNFNTQTVNYRVFCFCKNTFLYFQ